ncbi:hypothetical protein V8C35DRAFT_287780 [Trichoderma chlorosporum]
MHKQLLRSPVAALRVGAHFSRATTDLNLRPNAPLCIPSRHVSIGHEAASQAGRLWPDLVVSSSRPAVPTAWSPQRCG